MKYIIISALLLISCAVFVWSLRKDNEKTKYCGTVVKIPDLETKISGGKYQSLYNERYLVIRFDNGLTRAIKVDANTYYTRVIKSRICFMLTKEAYEDEGTPMGTLVVASLLVSCVIAFVLLIAIVDDTT